jgi:hypothetical protein
MNKPLRALLLPLVMCSVLASCDDEERVAANIKRLATDVRVTIADHALVLPLIALPDFNGAPSTSFSFDKKGDAERARNARDKLLSDSTDAAHARAFDTLLVAVHTYGWNDFDTRLRQICELLTHEWSRSVCNNPWAAIQQALPVNPFRLVDLRRLDTADQRGPAHCVGEQRQPLPQTAGEAVIVCEALVYGGDKDEFHHAVVRIDGELGALWTVWRFGQNGETAEAMTQREGQAIVAFVQYALGEREEFSTLHEIMRSLRRPGSHDFPGRADCAN